MHVRRRIITPKTEADLLGLKKKKRTTEIKWLGLKLKALTATFSVAENTSKRNRNKFKILVTS